ncbi:putative oxidoreductase [Helianthus anomalus]
MKVARGPTQNSLNWSEEEWDKTFMTNVKGAWLVSKYVCLQMRAFNQTGSIINISSIAGLQRTYSPGSLPYASSKSALDTMTKLMAMELGKHKIRVNSICPGLFKSEITEGLMKKKWFKNIALKVVPLREFGIADPALTSLVRYLIYESSYYVTGNFFYRRSRINLIQCTTLFVTLNSTCCVTILRHDVMIRVLY